MKSFLIECLYWRRPRCSLGSLGHFSILLLTVIVNLAFLGSFSGDSSSLLLVVSGWDDLGVLKTEVLENESKTLIRKEVVRPSPIVYAIEVSFALEGLGNHHNMEIWNAGNLLMGWKVSILLHNDDTFSEEELKD